MGVLAGLAGSQVAFREYTSGVWKEMTYSEYWLSAKRLAEQLMGEGYPSLIGSIGVNCFRWNILDLAIDMMGGTHASFFPTFEKETILHLISTVGMRVLFVPNETWAEIIRKSVGTEDHELEIRLLDQIEVVRAQNKVLDKSSIKGVEGRVSGKTVLFTSSSSGRFPKAILHENSSILKYAEELKTIYCLTSTDSALSVLPVCHGYEKAHNYCYQLSGIPINYAVSTLTLRENIAHQGPTIMAAVPQIVSTLMQELANPYESTGLVGLPRVIPCSGASLSSKIAEFYRGLGTSVIQSYGLSECLGVTSSKIGERNASHSGPALPYVDIIIENEEIQVRSETLFIGYLSRGGKIEKTDTNGFFRTGDLGRLDDDGNLNITGRKGDRFKLSNGKFYDPRKLEEQICKEVSPLIIAVIGQRPKGGLSIVINIGQVGEKEVRSEVGRVVSSYNAGCVEAEQIKEILFVSDVWGREGHLKTHTGKVKRAAVLKKYLSEDDSNGK